MEKIYCGNCGYSNSVENKFCNNCGGKLIDNDTSNKGIKSKKIKAPKSEQTLDEPSTSKYQTLSQKLTLLVKTSGYFTMYSSNCYIQFLKYETEKKLYVAIIHIDNAEKNIWIQLESLNFEQVEENLIRSFDIVSIQKTIKEVIAITKKIFEEIYLINPVEPFFYEILDEEKLEKQKVNSNDKAVKEKLEKQKVSNNYKAVKENTTEYDKSTKRGRTVVIIVVLIVVAFFLHYINTSNNSNQESTSNSSLTNLESDAFISSREFVKRELKSPHTASFPILDFTCTVKESDSSFNVISYVDSQNAFGASIRTKYIIKLKYTGGDAHDINSWNLINIFLFDENGERIN
jgi:hypothetical protein